ncbi:RILP-like protein 2 [Sciurus carolinensis]|uniref:RILP-like protein 2 n=1 Tax=Sciurus carolinensis TaxID=30640 RepID=A0AA41T5T6_SCICA|nr:RILP-like protein 2 [Sciurus carolinensis]
MEKPPVREEEEEEEEEVTRTTEGVLSKSPFQLTTQDVYDIYVVGRELMVLGSDPRVMQLQFKIVRMRAGDAEGDDKMVKDLTDPSLQHFMLQELSKLKSQLLVAQEELQCYKSGLIAQREGPAGRRGKGAGVSRACSADSSKEEKTIMKKLFSFRSGKQT